jgi:hypothetical protein
MRCHCAATVGEARVEVIQRRLSPHYRHLRANLRRIVVEGAPILGSDGGPLTRYAAE